MSGGRWRAATVTTTGERAYPGEVDTQGRWNGWARPRFTREVAEQVVVESVVEYADWYSGWHWRGDVLVLLPGPEAADPANPAEVEDCTEEWGPDADGRYHVGAWAWTWHEVDA